MDFINKGRKLRTFDKDARNIINTIRDVDSIILTQDERWYVNHIVSGFKAIGVWTKIKALYGFVGGTAATHKWNWKDMRDLDAAYRIGWNGTITHNNLGLQGDGMSGYGNTYLNPLTTFGSTQGSIGVYVNTDDQTGFQVELGVSDSTISPRSAHVSTRLAGNFQFGFATPSSLNGVISSAIGITIGTRVGNTMTVIKNGTQIASSSISSIGLPNANIYVLGWHFVNTTSDFLQYPSRKRACFAYISDNLTVQEAIQMSHIITTAQKILNRA